MRKWCNLRTELQADVAATEDRLKIRMIGFTSPDVLLHELDRWMALKAQDFRHRNYPESAKGIDEMRAQLQQIVESALPNTEPR